MTSQGMPYVQLLCDHTPGKNANNMEGVAMLQNPQGSVRIITLSCDLISKGLHYIPTVLSPLNLLPMSKLSKCIHIAKFAYSDTAYSGNKVVTKL